MQHFSRVMAQSREEMSSNLPHTDRTGLLTPSLTWLPSTSPSRPGTPVLRHSMLEACGRPCPSLVESSNNHPMLCTALGNPLRPYYYHDCVRVYFGHASHQCSMRQESTRFVMYRNGRPGGCWSGLEWIADRAVGDMMVAALGSSH